MNFTQIITQMVALGLSEEAIVAAVRVQTRQVRDGSFVTSDADHGDAVTAVTTTSVTGVTKRKRKGMTGAERMAKCRAKKAFQARQGAFDFENAVTPETVTEVVTVRDGDGDVTEIDLPSPKKVPLEPPKNTPLPSTPPVAASQRQTPTGGDAAQGQVSGRSLDDLVRQPFNRGRLGQPISPDWWPNTRTFEMAAERGFDRKFVERSAQNMRHSATTNRRWSEFCWDKRFWDWLVEDMEKSKARDSRPSNRATSIEDKIRSEFKGGAATMLAERFVEYEQRRRDFQSASAADEGGKVVDGDFWEQTN